MYLKYLLIYLRPLKPAEIVTPTNPTPWYELGHSPQPGSSVMTLKNDLACKELPDVL